MKTLKKYHKIWLFKYGFDEKWLRKKFVEGFHIHHIDGDKANENPENLMMIYGKDHIQLHGFNYKKAAAGFQRQLKRRIWISPDKKYFVIKRSKRESGLKFYHAYNFALKNNDKEEFIKCRCVDIKNLTEYEKARYL